MDAFVVMVYRQIKRFIRARSRVLGTIFMPLIWLIFFGLGWSKAFDFPYAKMIFGGVDYLSFLVPGVFAMSIFTGSLMSGISVLWDKQFGFLKELLVAPSSRKAGIAGRVIGDSLVIALQGLIILVFSLIIATNIRITGIVPAILTGIILSIAFSSIGISMALKMGSQEGFQLIMNFLLMPLLFLSGAFYPIDTMPDWMKYLAYIDPLTYAVDASRYFLIGFSKFSIFFDMVALAGLATVFLLVAMFLFERATIE
ncbi:MAG: ABC transporter [Thermoplasmata archaeon]|nr:MAG: ABC transporter [Thermoplasmata archaeon]KAA0017417.1 MAG: ABC transporter [Thermoplasmata archaeon]